MNKFSLNIGGKELTASFNRFAEKANGEAVLRYGDTVVFATVTMAEEETEKDFFPLSVNYEEKFYAAGKISGSRYTRREGRPSDKATLISRMIDRAVRPAFPEGLNKEIQIIITCLSFDEENDPGMLGMIAASLALHISDIPFKGPLGAVRVGKNKEYIINPTYNIREESELDVVVSGFSSEEKGFIINMIDGTFKETEEKNIEDAFLAAEQAIKEICKFQNEIRDKIGKEKITIPPLFKNEDIKKKIEEEVKGKVKELLEKEDCEDDLSELEEEIKDNIKEKYEEKEEEYARECLEKALKKEVRRSIMEKEKRVDGRKLDEIRKINSSVGLLPRTHGSALFERGETKALSVITLGAPGEEQLMDDMELSEKKRFMHHYNFPPYCVGETKPVRGPGRREIGHGMIGENSIFPLIPDAGEFPYTIRGVTEIVSSNGSTSMASVCGMTLALMDAGVPIKRPAAGISIGLVSDDEKGNHKLLTDIKGTEDHYGDMDFKVAGTREGVTVIQLDVKIEGLTKEMAKETLKQAKEARHSILEEMEKTISAPRENLSPFAPKIATLKIDKEKIGDVIGPRGKTINDIIEGTSVAIDIDDEGLISITSEKEESIEKAVSWIKNITREIKEGEVFQGKVVKIFGFGAVVEILPGQEGLVHISEIASKRIEKVEDEVSPGQVVPVKVIKVESGGKISLSIKRAKEE